MDELSSVENTEQSALKAVIVTSINAPNAALRALAEGAAKVEFDFIVIGDVQSPAEFDLANCRFMSLDDQLVSGQRFAEICPTSHYARKNVGYLAAMANGASLIVETDDDNFPRPAFFAERTRTVAAPTVRATGWVNVLRYFSDEIIWPRGLPLDQINTELEPFGQLPVETVDCPIQQGLADENPDVDAIYRLTLPLPQSFRSDRCIALGDGAWCPFNSQNTAWWPDAFPLLYLPAYCSKRCTDIWRSFVAQRVAWANGWHILIHEPTVWQERNEHNLMHDFADEVAGYLHNDRIRCTLEDLPLAGGIANIAEDLVRCYEALVSLELVGAEEQKLLAAWLSDIDTARGQQG